MDPVGSDSLLWDANGPYMTAVLPDVIVHTDKQTSKSLLPCPF